MNYGKSQKHETLPVGKDGAIGIRGPPGSSMSAAALLTKTQMFN